MRRHAVRAVFAILCWSLVAAPSVAKPQLAFLRPQDIAPATLLPPPPPAGSPEAAAELAEVRRLSSDSSPARWAQAKWDGEHESGVIFQSAIGPGFDLDKLPAVNRLLGEVQQEESAAAGIGKAYFQRPRPLALDPALKSCGAATGDNSYPSGHATMAYSMAVVLAAAMPDHGPQLLARARDYAQSRLICAAHFRSDVVAGQTLGTTVAVLLLRDPAFRADFEAARAELRAAHLTG